MKSFSDNYKNYDAITNDRLILKIANSRGKRPVITDLKNAYKLIDNIMIEINPCTGKDELDEIRNKLRIIIQSNSI